MAESKLGTFSSTLHSMPHSKEFDRSDLCLRALRGAMGRRGFMKHFVHIHPVAGGGLQISFIPREAEEAPWISLKCYFQEKLEATHKIVWGAESGWESKRCKMEHLPFSPVVKTPGSKCRGHVFKIGSDPTCCTAWSQKKKEKPERGLNRYLLFSKAKSKQREAEGVQETRNT